MATALARYDLSETTRLLNEPDAHQTPTIDGDPYGKAPEDKKSIGVEDALLTSLILVMSTAWFGIFLGALDSTIIVTLSGPISSEFNSLGLLAWLATAYLIANAACQPIAGRLTDICYHGIACSHFAKLDPSQYVIKYLPATLRPYNHPDTPQAERNELAERLEPIEVIGKDGPYSPPPQIKADAAPSQQP